MIRRLVLMFVEMLVVSLIRLAAFAAIGLALGNWAGGYGSAGLVFGAFAVVAFGAMGEVVYLIVERTWGRPRWPRWFLVAAWTLVPPQIAAHWTVETGARHVDVFSTERIMFHIFILIV